MQQIVVQLFNGIGNQMFQYAAGRWLAATVGASLKLVHHFPQRESNRPLLLQQYALRTPVEPMSHLDRLVITNKRRYGALSRAVRSVGRIQLLRQDPARIAVPFDFEIDSAARAVYLSGYFQEYMLVREVAALLRRDLVLARPLDGEAQAYAERIRSARRPISVHLRRGDYLTTFGPNGLLPMSYYERAIDAMQQQFVDATFFVFSDDIPFARFWSRAYPRMTVVDCNDGARAHECLHLMSLCRHHIIANSTFSWWGAWLNPRSDRQVIAPDHWLGMRTSSVPVACPDWQQLPAYRPLEQPAAARVARRA